MSIVWFALALTLVVEVPIVAAFYRGHRVRMALACVVATTATNVALNLVLSRTNVPYDPGLLGGELAALVVEGLVYALVAPQRDVPRALLVSATANFASFGVGLLVF